MLTFKLSNYTQLNQRLNDLLTTLNQTSVSPELAPYIDGIPAADINPTTVLQIQKLDKVKSIPNSKEFQKAGIDLTLTMPDCPVSASQLDAIATYATMHQSGIMPNRGRYVSYNHKANKWQLNPAGNQVLDDAITTLSGPDEKTYNLTVELFAHITTHSPDLIPVLFPDGKYGRELKLDWLVDNIKTYRKK